MIVIAAFPGCGKTTFVNAHPEVEELVTEDFLKGEVREHFPANFITALRTRMSKGLVTIVSSQKVIRDELDKASIHFTLVYPLRSCKMEYIWRALVSEDDETVQGLAKLFDNNWDIWIDQCEHQGNAVHLQLGHGQYLSDALALNGNGAHVKFGFETAQQPDIT